jgi:hypothetical protein
VRDERKKGEGSTMRNEGEAKGAGKERSSEESS